MLIVLAIFLIFGPDKIPGMARSLGKFINELKRASDDIKSEINREADKKEREQKLEDYKKKVQPPADGLKSQPRGASMVNDEPLEESKPVVEDIKSEDDKPKENATQ